MIKSSVIELFKFHYSTIFLIDEQSVRQLIVWLEDHKIRHYKIEARVPLKAIQDSNWPTVFKKYLSDLKCPFAPNTLPSVIDWLLGLAVQLEYTDDGKKCNTYHLNLKLNYGSCLFYFTSLNVN